MNTITTKINRKKCAVCGASKHALRPFRVIDNVPVYMGVSKKRAAKSKTDSLCYVECSVCNAVQLGKLIDLSLLYQENHNTTTVGETWSAHYKEFADFIKASGAGGRVCEVGDPSGKLAARLLDWADSYTVIEPNPHESMPKEVRVIPAWVGDASTKDVVADTVIMSHVFEHLYYPRDTLKSLRKMLTKGGKIFISVPNMVSILSKGQMPPGGMHFEHTMFLDNKILNYLFESSGFASRDVQRFREHSIFLCAEYIREGDRKIERPSFKSRSTDINQILDEVSADVERVSRAVREHDGPCYMYGAHFPAQLYFSLGLDKKRFSGVLDNSKSKVGRFLYGVNLEVYSPEILRAKKKPLVVCKMGPYTYEIKKQLGDICPGVVVI